jgi:hypothetical protein
MVVPDHHYGDWHQQEDLSWGWKVVKSKKGTSAAGNTSSSSALLRQLQAVLEWSMVQMTTPEYKKAL